MDDCFIAAESFETLQAIVHEMDVFATALGVRFKESKDVGTITPTFSLEYLGLQLQTQPRVTVAPTKEKLAKILHSLNELL